MTDGSRLAGWIGLVGLFAVLGYVGNFLAEEPAREYSPFFYWETSIGTTIQYAIVLGLVLLLARGRRELLALRRPRWGKALPLVALPLLVTYVVAGALSPFLNPGEEQGLTPESFVSSRAAQFFASVAVVVIVAPVVEEILFRGLGFSLLRPYGEWVAIAGVGIAFAVWHGLLEGLPVLFVFGAALAWLRGRTGSVYPGMIAHALFNGLAVTFSVLL